MGLGQELTASFVGEPRVRYRRLPVNLNFAIACNLGYAESTGELVVFLNNDTRSDTDWLPDVVAHLQDRDRRGCPAGAALPRRHHPDRGHACSRSPTAWPATS